MFEACSLGVSPSASIFSGLSLASISILIGHLRRNFPFFGSAFPAPYETMGRMSAFSCSAKRNAPWRKREMEQSGARVPSG